MRLFRLRPSFAEPVHSRDLDASDEVGKRTVQEISDPHRPETASAIGAHQDGGYGRPIPTPCE
jgi:hypothetical protein